MNTVSISLRDVRCFVDWVLCDHQPAALQNVVTMPCDPTRSLLSIVYFASFIHSVFLLFMVECDRRKHKKNGVDTEWRGIWKSVLETLASLQCHVVEHWQFLRKSLVHSLKWTVTASECSAHRFLFTFCLKRYFRALCHLFCVFDDGVNDDITSRILDVIGFALFHPQSVHHFQSALRSTEWFVALRRSEDQHDAVKVDQLPAAKRRKLNDHKTMDIDADAVSAMSGEWTSLFFETVSMATGDELDCSVLKRLIKGDVLLKELGLTAAVLAANSKNKNNGNVVEECSVPQVIGRDVFPLFVSVFSINILVCFCVSIFEIYSADR